MYNFFNFTSKKTSKFVIKMQIHKFGGGSLKNPQSIEQAIKIIKQRNNEPTLVVISAFAKTTNALENILYLARNDQDYQDELNKLKKFHLNITLQFFNDKNASIFDEIDQYFQQLEHALYNYKDWEYDIHYDATVSFGEILSTIIIHNVFDLYGLANIWLDAREVIITDTLHRDAIINWDLTNKMINEKVKPLLRDNNLIITQGFIGRSIDGYISTLGREGSDFSAAIFANCLNAECVTIWKDVPGIFNADPKIFDNAILLTHLNYKEAFELAYYGAKILHPKTIQPLEEKKIKLLIKNFLDPDTKGTLIDDYTTKDKHISSCIIKKNQVLISISPKDSLFISENDLSLILFIFSDFNIKINLMQTDAFHFHVCIDNNYFKITSLINRLNEKFNTEIKHNLFLVTLTHYKNAIFNILHNENIYIDQYNGNIRQCLTDSIIL